MASLYKISSPGPTPRSVLSYERGVLDEAAAVLDEDAVTPEMIMAEARRQAEQKVREAYAEGMRRGMEAGAAKYQEMVGESAAALAAAAIEMREARERFLELIEPQMVELAFEIAKRVIQREAETDRTLICRTVHKAVEQVLDRESVTVRVNPVDLEGMRAEKVRLLEQFDEIKQISIQADPTVGPGGCIVESDTMHVDACLDTQLQAIWDALRDVSVPREGE